MKAPSTMQWIRRAGQRLSTGSGRLATHLATRALGTGRRLWDRCRTWLAEVSGVAWLVRVAVLLGVAWILQKIAAVLAVGLARTVADGGAPWLMWGAALVWIVAAYRCGRPGWTPKPTPDEETPGTDEEAVPTGRAPAEWPPISPVALVAAVRDVGTPHAQLKPLAEHLRTTTDAVRAAAAAQGWPVKDVRMQGRSASAGLAWPPPELPPLDDVVGAGQRADDNDDDTSEEGPEKGLRVVRTESGLTVYDLADRHRRRGTVGP
ncbi:MULTISPECIES: hypothetical protein [unclassified Streptomyces]|uniref:hypothetical protein n=1 Tax=unclassified Streptomyces TaxID=2593676 RepID=UPI002E1786BB|nr:MULTISPECIES: hypothetical protein [unclassified Streptomyces]